jgi:hypothetical protein
VRTAGALAEPSAIPCCRTVVRLGALAGLALVVVVAAAFAAPGADRQDPAPAARSHLEGARRRAASRRSFASAAKAGRSRCRFLLGAALRFGREPLPASVGRRTLGVATPRPASSRHVEVVRVRTAAG